MPNISATAVNFNIFFNTLSAYEIARYYLIIENHVVNFNLNQINSLVEFLCESQTEPHLEKLFDRSWCCVEILWLQNGGNFIHVRILLFCTCRSYCLTSCISFFTSPDLNQIKSFVEFLIWVPNSLSSFEEQFDSSWYRIVVDLRVAAVSSMSKFCLPYIQIILPH